MNSNLLLIIKHTPLNYLEILCTCIAIVGQVCFHWCLIAKFVKLPWYITGSVGLVNGINEDVTAAKLLPTTVLTCAVDWVTFCHLLKTQDCFLCPYGRFNPWPATHLPLPPTPPPSGPPTSMMFHSLYYSCCKKLLKNQQC